MGKTVLPTLPTNLTLVGFFLLLFPSNSAKILNPLRMNATQISPTRPMLVRAKTLVIEPNRAAGEWRRVNPILPPIG